MKKLRSRGVKKFQVAYGTSKGWSQNSNSGHLAPQHQPTPTTLKTVFITQNFLELGLSLNQHCVMLQSFTAYSE